jgi:hypothetical protein
VRAGRGSERSVSTVAGSVDAGICAGFVDAVVVVGVVAV